MAHETAVPTLRVLGEFALRAGGRTLPLGASGRQVLAFLAVAGPAQRRETLAGRVWAWSSQARAHANLRNALWRIRQADRRLVVADRDGVRLGDDVATDLDASVALARRLLDHAEGGGDMPGGSSGLLEDDILPGWDDDWVLLERERHRQLRIHALEALSSRLAAAGRFADAVDAAFAAITAEPLRESAHAALIRAHLGEGNRSEATRQLAAYQRLLDDELGLRPSPALVSLVSAAVGR